MFTRLHDSFFLTVVTALPKYTCLSPWTTIVLEHIKQYESVLFFIGFNFAIYYWVSVVSAAVHKRPMKSNRLRLRVRLRALHRKYVVLSCYMLSAWFYSLYVQPFVHLRPYRCTKQPVLNDSDFCHNTNLILRTDKCDEPLIRRTPLQNKILLQTLDAYQAPCKRTSRTHFDSDTFEICVDTGASLTCTLSKEDFIPDSYVSIEGATINGIASGLSVIGYGTIRWVITDDNGDPIDVEIDRVLHIPDVPTQLLSPQQLVKQTNNRKDGFHVGAKSAVLTFGGFRKTINYNCSNNLPIFNSHPGINKFKWYNTELVEDGGISDHLTFNQRQLLHWHRRLGHMNYPAIQRFARLNLLPKELGKVRPEEYPICACCQFAKQKKRSVCPATEASPSIGAQAERPGDVISVDMIHSPVRV